MTIVVKYFYGVTKETERDIDFYCRQNKITKDKIIDVKFAPYGFQTQNSFISHQHTVLIWEDGH